MSCARCVFAGQSCLHIVLDQIILLVCDPRERTVATALLMVDCFVLWLIGYAIRNMTELQNICWHLLAEVSASDVVLICRLFFGVFPLVQDLQDTTLGSSFGWTDGASFDLALATRLVFALGDSAKSCKRLFVFNL